MEATSHCLRSCARFVTFAVLAWSTVGGSGISESRAEDVIDTIHVTAGASSFNAGTVPLNGKYHMIITGTTRRQLGPDFSVFDALYCFDSSSESSPCKAQGGFPSDADMRLAFYLQSGSETPGFEQLKSTVAFADQTPYPDLSASHTYDLPFTASGGTKLFVETWPDFIFSTDEFVSGEFTIQVFGEQSKADKTIGKCQQAINKGSADYFKARVHALAKCQKARLSGKLVAANCTTEPKALETIGKAQEKMQKAIRQGCAGADKVCHTADDVSLAKVGFGATCPDYRAFGCKNALSDCDDLAACLLCIDAVAADQAASMIGNTGLSDPKSQKPLNKCQQGILAAGLDYVTAISGIYEKCTDQDLKHKHDPTCIHGPKGVKISNLEHKLSASIEKACGPLDSVDTFTSSAVGATGHCPRVTPPDRPSEQTCFDASFGPLVDLRDCIDCTSPQEAECAVFAASPAVHPDYPFGCSGPVFE